MTEGKATKKGFWAKPEVDRRGLRQFGMVMVVGLGVIGGWAWYRGNGDAAAWLGGFAGSFLLGGLLVPTVLKPLYIIWMYLARVLGWVNTHLLLGLVFYTLFTLIGGIMRGVRYDPLDRRREPERESYWRRRSPSLLPRNHYERQF